VPYHLFRRFSLPFHPLFPSLTLSCPLPSLYYSLASLFPCLLFTMLLLGIRQVMTSSGHEGSCIAREREGEGKRTLWRFLSVQIFFRVSFGSETSRVSLPSSVISR